jgi:2-succinyl-5-enolpyruvyl-6-hydroxy-3-cyclohexene-1-carboxylate synthase
MQYQPIYDIAAVCARKGVDHVVLCPGSRCAPLTLAFTRHPDITSKTFSDERSAGFVALGMSQSLKSPVAVVCTSGTAVYNLAPAVAEAFFSHTPLLILTADRPAEWIAQHDGQTIYQSEVFGKHVKKYFQLPQEYDHPDSVWAINRIVNEAINLSLQEPRGPVHINAPFREPLYPQRDEVIRYTDAIREIDEVANAFELSDNQKIKIAGAWPRFRHILIVAGQQHPDEALLESLETFFKTHDNIPFACDIISNLQTFDQTIKHTDLFLGQASDALRQTLRPDLLITFGQSLISKNLKLFLRKYSPGQHWHIQPGGMVADTFKNVTAVLQTSPSSFFNFASTLPRAASFEDQKQNNYSKLWEVEERRTQRTLTDFMVQPELAELEVVKEVIKQLPRNCNLHLANSMSVRYANFVGLEAAHKGIRVFSNRGTSGIDGCSSTTVGHYLADGRPTFLITGDLAFFYDRNAFWHNYPLHNLRVLLLNNHGGLIFNMIDGPASLPEAADWFITRQQLKAQKLCEEFGFDHLKLDSRKKLKNLLKDFFDFDGKTKILELETDVEINKRIFDDLKLKIKKSYEL